MKKIFIAILVLIILMVFIGWLFKMVFISQTGSNQTKIFVIEEGQGVNQISQNLKKQGLLNNSFVFETYLWARNLENKLQAGEHKLNDTWSIRRLVNALISGHAIENEQDITILEGWNLRDIAEYLATENIVTKEDFYQITGLPAVDYDRNPDLPRPEDFSADYEFLTEKPDNVSLEGYLFPDTYRIFKETTAEEIVRKMLANFDRKISSQMLGDIYNQNKKLYEIVTLASIIEKEGDTPENKKKVSGVYYNRLDLGMALQADPTVNYVTGKVTDRPTFDDIASDNPYNTYQYPGLPPGPICNPGLDSIMAAIYPDKNDYYYFINTPDGEMIFAKNFEEHKQNRAKYFEN
jgi:UPF0755 protein